MLGDLDDVINAQFIYREISINQLIEILNQIKEDQCDLWFDVRVCPNWVGNLTVINKNDQIIGYIDIGAEEYFKFKEESE